MSAEHTRGPWSYRPEKHDDWGMIRDCDGAIMCVARAGSIISDHDAHRRAGTDPYEPNGRFIVRAVNNHDALVKALKQAQAVLATLIDPPANSSTLHAFAQCKAAETAARITLQSAESER